MRDKRLMKSQKLIPSRSQSTNDDELERLYKL